MNTFGQSTHTTLMHHMFSYIMHWWQTTMTHLWCSRTRSATQSAYNLCLFLAAFWEVHVSWHQKQTSHNWDPELCSEENIYSQQLSIFSAILLCTFFRNAKHYKNCKQKIYNFTDNMYKVIICACADSKVQLHNCQMEHLGQEICRLVLHTFKKEGILENVGQLVICGIR